MNSIPSEEDWRSEQWDLDIPYAYKHFAGKSLDESIALFRHAASLYQEDLIYMPTACFRYYIKAYTAYLLSDESKGDADGANGFFSLVKFRKADIRDLDEASREEIARTLQEIASKQHWFDASVEIYGDFKRHTRKSLKAIRGEKKSP